MPTGEPLYTLAEARRVLARQECDKEGHDVEDVPLYVHPGVTRHQTKCVRCGATFVELEG